MTGWQKSQAIVRKRSRELIEPKGRRKNVIEIYEFEPVE